MCGSYNQQYDTQLLDKAKSEYETWLSKKAEREGGFGGDDGYGTRDWVPRDRELARPGISQHVAREVPPATPLSAIPQTPTQSNQYGYEQAPDMGYPGYWDPHMYYWPQDPQYYQHDVEAE